ncbi:MAG: methionine adenosyltransferase [Halanaerobiaceae bacterium]
MTENYLFTSESVTEGHPDKVADQISDAILDAILEKDSRARVACEAFVTTGMALISGEISTDCYVDVSRITRNTIKNIGYTRAKYGFDGETCAVLTSIDEQSSDIARGVDEALEVKKGKEQNELGAGDQGLMFGFACRETQELMPLPIMLAHKLARRLAYVRREEILSFLRPDGKSQVTVEYDGYTPVRVDKVLVSAQHEPDVEYNDIRDGIIEEVVQSVISPELMDEDTEILVNPTGRFVIGGPQGDTGLTGRKIIVDTYGGTSRHGGGAFSGKDPTKVDRSAAYGARYVAKNLVASGLADRCEVQISYAIGVAEPLSIMVDTFGTGKIEDHRLAKAVREVFDLRPARLIENLALQRPIYNQVSVYGHFGRSDLILPWEKTDKAELLASLI